MFTLKRDLDKLGNENDIMEISSSSTPNEVDNETNKKIRTRSKDPLLSQKRQRCDILPTVCLFCEKVTKYHYLMTHSLIRFQNLILYQFLVELVFLLSLWMKLCQQR